MNETITLGTAYYPEHWPRENWLPDIRKIREAGMTTLRLAELAWSTMEPEEGRFELDWLEEFIALAYREGLHVILGTPSEASPVWLRDRHPEVLSVDRYGHRTGGRGHHCHTSPVYRRYISRMTEEMARRFAGNPAVIGWQIDNELRGVECYCSQCRAAYQDWLKRRYGTLSELNRRWGTHFWSQTYNTWEEICLPGNDQLTISTSQVVDFKRFISDTTVSFQDMQIDIIKKYAPHQFVSHNSLNALYYSINMYDLARRLDVYAWDIYPHVDEEYVRRSLGNDLARGTKHDNFWILEQKNGYFNGSAYNLALEPGIVRAWTYQNIARGANGILYYRWRANRWGQEQNPNGILRHDGTPRRAYYEISQICRELAPISGPLAATRVRAEVAILQNYSDIWAEEAKKQYTNIGHEKVTMEFYRQLLRLGVTADLVQPDDKDLARYKVVFAPNLMLVSDADAQNLKQYVAAGGCLVVGVRAGMKNEDNVVTDQPWPGPLRELCGVTVDEFEAFPEHTWNTVEYRGKVYDARMWADVLHNETAQVQAVYHDKFYRGSPAVTRNRFGKGSAVYFGVAGCPDLIRDYLPDLLAEYGVSMIPVPGEVYVAIRESAEKKYLFLINMNRADVGVDVPFQGVDCLTGRRVGTRVLLPPLGVVLMDCSPETQE